MGATGLLDLLVPDRCAACGGGESPLCAACASALLRLMPPLCARCGAPTAWPVERCGECAGRRLSFRTARAAVRYEGPARSLVTAWKERGLRRIANLAAGLVTQVVPAPPVQAVAFVPGETDRTLWRGVNTAEALAEGLAGSWDLPLLRVLRRRGPAPRQRGLSRTDRRANVRDAFEATVRVPARIVLVDDVYTTGATVGAAAAELRRAGARAVEVVTFARAVRN